MTTVPSPAISVLLPVRNGVEFLPTAVKSVLAQTDGDFELLVVDDGSTDGSGAVAEAFRDPRIRVLRNDESQGVAGALNRGLSEARGRLVARLDADDRCHPERFERQRRFLDAHPEVGVLGTAHDREDASGASLGQVFLPTDHDAIIFAMPFGNPLAHPSVMFRREVVERAGGYKVVRPPVPFPEDYDLWLRLADSTRFANLPEPLVTLVKHVGSVTSVWGQERTFLVAAELSSFWMTERMGEPVPPVVAGALLSRSCDSAKGLSECLDLFRRWYRRSSLHEGKASDGVRLYGAELYWELLRYNLRFVTASALPDLGSAFANSLLRVPISRVFARIVRR